jgi:hypothetical protein
MVPEAEAVLALGESMEEEERVEEHACGVGGGTDLSFGQSMQDHFRMSSMGNLIFKHEEIAHRSSGVAFAPAARRT